MRNDSWKNVITIFKYTKEPGFGIQGWLGCHCWDQMEFKSIRQAKDFLRIYFMALGKDVPKIIVEK